MSRIRTVKPEFWTSAQVLECSTNARLLFIGLWNFCDDAGRHADNAKQIKAEVFPADDFTQADILGMLDELSANGLIVRYSVENKDFFYVSGWRHQRIDKPQPPRYPAPLSEHSKNDLGTLPPEGIGKEGKGEGGVPPSRESVRGYFATLGAEFLTDEFIDHHQARDWKLSKGGKMKDWQAACRTWHRKDQEWNPARYKPDPYATTHASQL